jgi:transposase
MLSLPPAVRVFVAVEPFDMRSFDAIAGAVRRIGLDPVDGHLYLFFNKRRRLAKALWFDGSGWCLLAKRLEAGSFQLPPFDGDKAQITIEGSAFASLLAGIDFTAARRGWYRGRRKFRDAEATHPVLAAEGGAFIGAMYGEEEKAQTLGLRGDALREHRQQRIGPIAREFEIWLDAVHPTLLPSEPLAAAIAYYKNHRDALFRLIDDPLVPIDNSPTEREFQNVAKLRLNMLFAGSTEGAHRACVLLGIIATCRALKVPAQAYLA